MRAQGLTSLDRTLTGVQTGHMALTISGHGTSLEIDECFDTEGDLGFEAVGSETQSVYLPRDEVVRLRNHLNKILSV